MTLSQLIEHVGNEHVRFQRLDECAINASTNKKGVTTLQIKTDGITCNDIMRGLEGRTVGFLIFMPTARLPKPEPQEKPA